MSEELGGLIDAMQVADTIVEIERRRGTRTERLAVLAAGARPDEALLLEESDVDVWTWEETEGEPGAEALVAIVRELTGVGPLPTSTTTSTTDAGSRPSPSADRRRCPPSWTATPTSAPPALLERHDHDAASEARRALRRSGLSATDADRWCALRAGAVDTFVAVGHRGPGGARRPARCRWITAADGRIVLLEPEPELDGPIGRSGSTPTDRTRRRNAAAWRPDRARWPSWPPTTTGSPPRRGHARDDGARVIRRGA